MKNRTPKRIAVLLMLALLLQMGSIPTMADTDVSNAVSLEGALSLNALMDSYTEAEEAPIAAGTQPQDMPSVTIEYVGADGEVLLRESVAAGVTISAPAQLAPEKEGCAFLGWDTAFPLVNVQEDVTIRALFRAWPTARFVAWIDGRKVELHREAFAPGSAVTYGGDTPQKDGFRFEGWRPALELSPITKDSEYVAQFAGISIYRLSVYYLYEDGTMAAQPEMRTLLYGDTYTVDSPQVMGFAPDQASLSGVAGGEENEIVHIVTYTVDSGTPYKVAHYLHKVGGAQPETGDQYAVEEFDLAYTVELVSLMGATITVLPGFFEGFSLLNAAKTYRIAADGSTEINLFYGRNTYSIEFDTDGGTFVDPIIGEYGAEITLAQRKSSPAKAGYIFKGWNEGLPETIPAKDLLRTAQWEADIAPYKIALWTQNADDDNYTYYSVIDMPATAVGSKIDLSAANLPMVKYFTYDEAKTNQRDWLVEGDGSTIVTAYYSRNEYTVVFDIPAGTSKAPSLPMVFDGKTYQPGSDEKYSITVRYDENIADIWPTAAFFPDSAADLAFTGWTSPVKGASKASSKRLTLATDLFYENGDDFVMTATFESVNMQALHYKIESVTQAEGDNRVKYDGTWYDESLEVSQVLFSSASSWGMKAITGLTGKKVATTETSDPYYNAEAAKNYNLYYTRSTYKIQFYNQNEDIVESPSIKFGFDVADYYWEPECPSNLAGRGYTFGGWYGEANCSDESRFVWEGAAMPAGNLPLFAKWTPPSFDVICTAEGGYERAQSIVEDNYAARPAEDPARDGFEFLGWYIEGTTVPFHFDKQKITRDFSLVARWAPRTDISYEVRYREAGTDVLLEEARVIADQVAGDAITEDAPVIEGYVVDARSKSTSLRGADNAIDFYYTPFDTIAYAVQYRLANADGSAGEEIAPAEARVFEGRVPIVTEEAKRIAGYMPERWNEQKTLTASPEDNTFVFLYTENDRATYTIVQYIENPDGTYSEERITAGPAPVGTYVEAELLEGAEAQGLSIDPEASAPGGYVENGGSLTLRVRYTRDVYTVTYALEGEKPDGVALAQPEMECRVGETVSLPAWPNVPQSHAFGGWKLPDGIAVTDETFIMPAADVRISGEYTAKRLSISFGEGENGRLEGDLTFDDVRWGDAWEDIISALPTPQPDEGYYFAGWNAEFPDTITGDLVISPIFAAKTPIRLVADSEESIYTGQEQSIEGYSIEGLEGTAYAEGELRVEGVTAGGSGTQAGAYGVTFAIGDGILSIVHTATQEDIAERFIISGYDEGAFTIAPRPVTLDASILSDAAESLLAEFTVADGDAISGLVAEGDLGEITFGYRHPDGEGAPLKVGDIVTVFPVYTENENYDVAITGTIEIEIKGQVHYDANYPSGEKGIYTQDGTFSLGEEATLLDARDMGFAADGYTFEGWGLEETAEAAFQPGDALQMGGSSPKLYACWAAVETPPAPTAAPTQAPVVITAAPAQTATAAPTKAASSAAKTATPLATLPPEETAAPAQYTLTVLYKLEENDSQISAPTLVKLAEGEPYSVRPLDSVLFAPLQETIEGIMPAQNITIAFDYETRNIDISASMLEEYDPQNPPEEIVAARNRTAPAVFVVSAEDITQQSSMSSRNLGDCGQ